MTRFGVLAVPEAFEPEALQCSGFGNLETRERHAMSCMECACELRYVARDFPWDHVLRFHARAGIPLNGNERARLRWERLR